ncbi:MAG TPA: GFA family protein [Paraburkholderia sp.]|jgi:hypothetical protein|nr:GFA family protein [Paraburkholderia sp.]
MEQVTQATEVHEGGCACGAVRFRAYGAPNRVGICHCMTCRRIHGSAFGSYAVFARSAVQFSGTTQVWRSSEAGRRHFCPVCGSVAFMEYGDEPEIDVPLGAFDRVGEFEPTYELWCDRREPWLPRGVRTEFAEDRS